MKGRIKRSILLLSVLVLMAAIMPVGLSIDAEAATAGYSTVEFYSGGKLISESEYSSFGQAWNAAYATATDTTEAVITVGADYVLDSMLSLKDKQHITIDLNGYCLRRELEEPEDEGGLFTVKNKAVLTIKDSRPKSTGYDGIKGGVLADGASSDTGGCFEIQNSGKVIIEGGTVYNCTTDMDGGCAHIYNGTLKMTGGRIYFCRTIDSTDNCHGGAVYLDGNGYGYLYLNDCKIDNCYSEDDGGAIFSDWGVMEFDNVIFSGNKCRDYGGAICLWNNTSLYAKNCFFVNNNAEDDAGAVYVDDAPSNGLFIVFENCKFRDNSAGHYGGAIYVCDDTVVLSNCEVTGNYAKECGGGIYVESLYDITLRGLVTIDRNTCDDNALRNLTLQDAGASAARVMSAGLYRGSHVGIGSTDDNDDTRLSYNFFKEYQMRYFFPDDGYLTFDKIGTYSGTMVTSSLFGKGSVTAIIIIGTVGVFIAAGTVILKKKTDRKQREGGAEQ